MFIKSNTKRKIEKILAGKVFDSPLVFITELLQNSYRAKCTQINITIQEDVFIFEDNGCGLKNPDNLLTLDSTEWDSTDEGFGIGFWSVLGVPNIKSVEVESNGHNIILEGKKLKENLEVTLNKVPFNKKGFKVILNSDYFITHLADVIMEINHQGRFLPMKIILNNSCIEQRNLFDDIEGDYVKKFNNELFTAKLSVTKDDNGRADVYYEHRFVKRLYTVPYIKGVIHLKPKAVDLKEPDRKSIIYNDKLSRFEKKCTECSMILYKEFLKSIAKDLDMVNDYSYPIVSTLPVKDFEDLLYIDKSTFKADISTLQRFISNNVVDREGVLSLLGDDWTVSNDTTLVSGQNFRDLKDVDIDDLSSFKIGDVVFAKKSVLEEDNYCETAVESIEDNLDVSDFQLIENEDIHITQKRKTTNYKKTPNKNENSIKLKSYIKKEKFCFWVKANEVDDYSDLIALAKYNGLNVLVSKNDLFESYFDNNNIPHISNLEDYFTEEYSFTNNNPKNKKEESFLMLLEPIRKKYNLPVGVFKIGDIVKKNIINVDCNEKVKVFKNKPNNIVIYGVCSKGCIILDRRAMNLKAFNLSLNKGDTSIGKGELKCLLHNITTIAHELAHLLYGTVDNTDLHFKMQTELTKEIGDIYINY